MAAETSKVKQLFLQEFGQGLTQEQLENAGALIDRLPVMMANIMAELAGRLTWAPSESYNDVAEALAVMLKGDVKNGDDKRTD